MGDDTALAEGLGFKSFRLLRWLMATMRAVLLPLRRKQVCGSLCGPPYAFLTCCRVVSFQFPDVPVAVLVSKTAHSGTSRTCAPVCAAFH